MPTLTAPTMNCLSKLWTHLMSPSSTLQFAPRASTITAVTEVFHLVSTPPTCLRSSNALEMMILLEDTADSLTLMFESPSQDRIADFELKLMDIDSEPLGIPDTEYKCTIHMPSAEFQRIIRDLQVIGDTCIISCTKEGVRFSVQGDIGTGNVLVRSGGSSEKEEDQVTIEMEEPVELTFALRYLNFFTKATPLGPRVILSLSPEVPVVVEYPIEECGEIKYYLAPKIDEGE